MDQSLNLDIGKSMEKVKEKKEWIKKIPNQNYLQAQRIVVTGHVIEVYSYQYMSIRRQEIERDGEGIDREENYRKRMKMRREMVRRLGTMNFTNKDNFYTLTFRDTEEINIKDVKQTNKLFKQFVQRLKRRFGVFKYLAVVEYQDTYKRGAVHYHMMTDLPCRDVKVIGEIWGNGFVLTEKITHVDNLGAYLVKYMTKSSGDQRLQGEKGYLCSKGLKRPEEFSAWDESKQLEQNSERVIEVIESLKGKVPVYTSTYQDEHRGLTTYQQFNLQRL